MRKKLVMKPTAFTRVELTPEQWAAEILLIEARIKTELTEIVADAKRALSRLATEISEDGGKLGTLKYRVSWGAAVPDDVKGVLAESALSYVARGVPLRRVLEFQRDEIVRKQMSDANPPTSSSHYHNAVTLTEREIESRYAEYSLRGWLLDLDHARAMAEIL